MSSTRRGHRRTLAAGSVSVLAALALLGSSVPALAGEGGSRGERETAPRSSPRDDTRAQTPPGTPVTEAATAESALVAAQMSGRRVEVLDLRTETSTTWADPEGTLTTTVSGGPVRMDAADIAPAGTSDSRYAAIAETATGTVTVPWDPSGAIEVKPDDISAVGIGSAGRATEGVNLGGSVVYADAGAAVDTVVQPTLAGGSRTLQVIKRADAPHEYRVPLRRPAGSALRQESGGSVVIVPADPDEPVAAVNAPWARDARGAAVPTSYRLDGDTLVQRVDFTASTAFPVVADPWWNPFSWKWKKTGKTVKKAAKKCGMGVLAAYVPVQAHHVSVNIQRARAGLRMVKFAGGPWGYVSIAAAGCLMGQLS
ncbi:hypothetical protein GT045_27325 [Streptomyces sp. SID486]|uniref:hypothetical protein n=1 Tax=Streptomyces sp. SID486 TaxID=2690264 RepID=UPI0013679F6B|nr:hypothetical protein [Streptomyces sp. SID486]MYX98414.1 hypothetical protein [Streptomyces sp. SID486]